MNHISSNDHELSIHTYTHTHIHTYTHTHIHTYTHTHIHTYTHTHIHTYTHQGTFCSVSRRESRCKLRRSLINNKNTSEKSRIIVLIFWHYLCAIYWHPVVAAWLEINTKSVAPAMLASHVSLGHPRRNGWRRKRWSRLYVAVKHVLSTLFIEHTPSASS